MAKQSYNAWSQSDMEKALSEHRNGILKFNERCRTYNIPKPAFRRHLKGLKIHQHIGRPKAFEQRDGRRTSQTYFGLRSKIFWGND